MYILKTDLPFYLNFYLITSHSKQLLQMLNEFIFFFIVFKLIPRF